MRHTRKKHHDAFGPFGQVLEELFNTSIGDIVGGDISHNTPSVNTHEMEDAYYIEVAVPGVAKEDIRLRLEENHLIVEAEVESTDQPAYKRREFDYSKFSRRFKLKDNIDTKKIKANHDLGILTIKLPKLDAKAYAKKTSIKID